jgi:hypothetical protein
VNNFANSVREENVILGGANMVSNRDLGLGTKWLDESTMPVLVLIFLNDQWKISVQASHFSTDNSTVSVPAPYFLNEHSTILTSSPHFVTDHSTVLLPALIFNNKR